MNLKPGVYEFRSVEAAFGEGTEGLVPLKSDRIRFVTDQTVHGEHAVFEVHLDDEGTLQVRCIEGRLLISSLSSNLIGVHVDSLD